MNTPHICRTCRRKLFGKPQWVPKASFISLSSPRTTTDGEANSKSLSTERPGRGGAPTRDRAKTEGRKFQRKSSKASKGGNGDLLEALFSENIKRPPVRKATRTPKTNSTKLEDYENLEKLREMSIDPNASIGDIWRFLTSALGPSQLSVGPHLASFNVIMGKIFQKLIRERTRSPYTPTVTEIVKAYSDMELLRLRDFKVAFESLFGDIAEWEAKALQDSSSPNADSAASPSYDDLVGDIVGTWKVLFLSQKSLVNTSALSQETNENTWLWLSDFEAKLSPPTLKRGKPVTIESVYEGLLPDLPPNQLRTVAMHGLMTFALLRKSSISMDSASIVSHPLMSFFAKSLARTRQNPRELQSLARTAYPFLASNIDWTSVLQEALATSSWQIPEQSSVGEAHSSQRPDTPAKQQSVDRHVTTDHASKSGSASIHRQLSRSLIERNLHKVDALWRDAVSGATSRTSQTLSDHDAALFTEDNNNVTLSEDMYNHFIMVYTGLRQPDRAIDVWNHMITRSVAPTQSTWNAMLEGCKTTRSAAALEGVWSKLILTGIKPDMVCWTTRISGLADCNRPDMAIRALEDMGRMWTEAAKAHNITNLKNAGDIDGTIKPTIQNINAAFAGLLRRGKNDAANRLLMWGAKLGIKPDIITYNTLLRPLVRDGRTDEVQRLLKVMQQAGVHADVATFTTILEETFRLDHELSPAQQSEAVNSVFAEMEAAGVHANQQTYGKMIYSLLQTSSGDMSAVQAVLKRMTSQGVNPSAHIYTMLVEHHFKQEHPDLEAVRSIIERVKFSGAIMDHIFWDRVIEGYARLKDTTSALTILGREDREGQRVGWPALEMVLRALAENEEWDMAHQVVRNVTIDRGGPPPEHVKGIEGQHSFWRTVEELGIGAD